MKTVQLSEVGSAVMDHLCGNAGDSERDSLNALLKTLPKAQRLEIDEAVGAWGVACLEAGFLAGLKAGSNPLALLVNS